MGCSLMYESNRLKSVGNYFWNPDSIIHRQITEYILEKHYASVLDYGAGNSPYKSYVSCERYLTADITQNSTKSIDFLILPGENLKIADASFDLILLLDVLEHVPDSSYVLAELRRLIKPGGSIIISLPFIYREHETPNDYCRYTYFGVKKLVSDNGGKICRVEKLGNAYYTLLTLFLERGICNGERSVLGLAGKLLNKLALFFFPLLRPILAAKPSIDAGCYHHLLMEIRFHEADPG
jgi:SAM-dependent methyltransferase